MNSSKPDSLVRARPKILGSGQTLYHDLDHSEMDERCGGSGQTFEVTGEPSVAADPGQRALDDPPLGQDDEALGLGRAFDNLDPPITAPARRLSRLWSLVSCIGEDHLDEREASPGAFVENQSGTVAVLYAGRMHHHLQQQSRVIGQHMAFDPLHFLARVIPTGSTDSPLFAPILNSGCR